MRMFTLLLSATALVGLVGCVDLVMETCGTSPNPLGMNDPGTARVRTSHYRAVLADASAAAGRVLPYALMSEYAYRLGPGCADAGNKIRLDDAARAEVESQIAATTAGPSSRPWTRIPALSITVNGHSECEDDEGMAYHVWERALDGRKLVAVAFRGTSGDGDWKYGNLWWVARFAYRDNQYTRAREHMQAIIRYYDEQAATEHLKSPRFVATGHSLGGGLAQHMLYSFPERVEQAIVFDPSSITAYADVDREHHVKACACEVSALQDDGISLEPEARILRVYQTYEVLTDLRIIHKVFFEPERHVMEIRFPFEAPVEQVQRHSMRALANGLFNTAGTNVAYSMGPSWLQAKGDEVCTKLLADGQRKSCSIDNQSSGAKACPR